MNGSILIPERFRLNKKLIQVLVDDDYCNGECFWGEADFTEKVITLCHRYHKKILKKSVKEKTFYHELIHQILDSMGYEKLKYDEDFVDLFSERLYEFEKTKQ